MRTEFSKAFNPNDFGREADQLRDQGMRALQQDNVSVGRRLYRAANAIDATIEAYLALR